MDHFISLNAKADYVGLNRTSQSSSVSVLITFSHEKSVAPDYNSSDSTVTFIYVHF